LVDPTGENAAAIIIVGGGMIAGGWLVTHPHSNIGQSIVNWWNSPHWWDFPEESTNTQPYCEAKKSGKEKASDVPSWAKGNKPSPNQKCQDFAKQLLNTKYGVGNWSKGAGTEYSKIVKWCQRSLK